MKEHNILSCVEEIIMNETGIVISKERFIDLEIVLHSRLTFYKMLPEEYIKFLKHNYGELILLASCFTIQETSFYRYKAHFDRMKLEVIPELLEKNKQQKTLRIVSAGCSTGEEPYTIAMILNDAIPDIKEWNIRILATDINENALKIATEGVYSKYKLRNIEEWYINRYFEKIKKEDNSVQFKLKDYVKNMVSFRQYNLIKEPFDLDAPDSTDMIICENVIIYFCHTSIQRLIDNFYSLLKMNGYLFMGYSETLNFVTHEFGLSWWNDSFAYKKTGSVVKVTYSPVKNIHLHEEYIDEKLKSNNKEFFDDLIHLILKNYKEGSTENVGFLIRKIEQSNVAFNEDFFIIKAEFLFDAGEYINAANECRKAININPHCLDAHILLSAIYLQFDMLDSADFEIHTSLYINNASVLANYYSALYYRKIEDEKQAAHYLNLAHELLDKRGGIPETRYYPINANTWNGISSDLSNIKNNHTLQQ